ncbi:MAG: uracil-DNA glycosylase family protein [Bacilli bacterium]|nr:uracil-DNA glycosylase family protein [Bacilli bacterium]
MSYSCIKECKNCGLYLNQTPLIETKHQCDIFFVGLSAKRIKSKKEVPLSSSTNSGKIIENIENKINLTTYKTNLVKCLPLDEKNNLRYPNLSEKNACFDNLQLEIKTLKPKIIFLLGSEVASFIAKKINIHLTKPEGYNFGFIKHSGIYYVHIYHPSYIYVYKRKELDFYINGVIDVINATCNQKATQNNLNLVECN